MNFVLKEYYYEKSCKIVISVLTPHRYGAISDDLGRLTLTPA